MIHVTRVRLINVFTVLKIVWKLMLSIMCQIISFCCQGPDELSHYKYFLLKYLRELLTIYFFYMKDTKSKGLTG